MAALKTMKANDASLGPNKARGAYIVCQSTGGTMRGLRFRTFKSYITSSICTHRCSPIVPKGDWVGVCRAYDYSPKLTGHEEEETMALQCGPVRTVTCLPEPVDHIAAPLSP